MEKKRIIDLDKLNLKGATQDNVFQKIGFTEQDQDGIADILSRILSDRTNKGEFTGGEILAEVLPQLNASQFTMFALLGLSDFIQSELDEMQARPEPSLPKFLQDLIAQAKAAEKGEKEEFEGASYEEMPPLVRALVKSLRERGIKVTAQQAN